MKTWVFKIKCTRLHVYGYIYLHYTVFLEWNEKGPIPRIDSCEVRSIKVVCSVGSFVVGIGVVFVTGVVIRIAKD